MVDEDDDEHNDGNIGDSALVFCPLRNESAVFPLSGCPFFTSIISKSNVQQPYQLVIPRSFQDHLPLVTVPVTLQCRSTTWQLKYYGDKQGLRRFGPGWKTFAMDNGLKIGDACVFELLESGEDSVIFSVQILDGTAPVHGVVRDV